MINIKKWLSFCLASVILIAMLPVSRTTAKAETATSLTATDDKGNQYTAVLADIDGTSLGVTEVYKLSVMDGFERLDLNFEGFNETIFMCFCGNSECVPGGSGTTIEDGKITFGNVHTYFDKDSRHNDYSALDPLLLEGCKYVLTFLTDDTRSSYKLLLIEIRDSGDDSTISGVSIQDADGTSYPFTYIMDGETGNSIFEYDAFPLYKVVVPSDADISFVLDENSEIGQQYTYLQCADASVVDEENPSVCSIQKHTCLNSVKENAMRERFALKDGEIVFLTLYIGEDLSNGINILIYFDENQSGDDTTAPTLERTEIIRTVKGSATVKFTSDEAGVYYYAWTEVGAAEPDINTSGDDTAMSADKNVITLSGLTSGSKKLYVKAKDESGNVSDVFVFDIPEEPMYSLTLYTQTNGEVIEKVTIDGEVAEININSPYNNTKYTVFNIPVGSEVKVWVLPPDTTKDIETVTLSSSSKIEIDGNYILFSPKIEGNTFTFIMPMYDVRTRKGTVSEGTYWLTLKEAEKPRVALTGTVENFPNSKIKMGSVEYTVGGETVSQVYAGTEVTAKALPDTNTYLYEVEFRYWEAAEGITLSEEQKNSQTLTFTVPEGVTEVNLKPVFEKVGTTVSWSTDLPGTSIKSGSGTSETDIIKNGVTLNLQCIYDSLYHKMIGWTVIRDGVDITDSADVEKSSNGDFIYVKISGDEITITAHLEYKAAATVTASANDDAMGSAVLSDGTVTQQSIMITEGQDVTLTATPNHGYQFNNWTVTDSDGNSIEVTVDAENANKAVFVMPDTGKDISAVANFSISDEVLDAAADVTDVYLTIDGQQFYANKDGTSYTITLPAGTSTENLADAALTIEHAERASVTKNGEEWASGQPCGMAADTPASFAVTSKDGTNVNEFTVTITAEKRSGNDITAVELLNEAGGASAVVSGVIDNENNTVTVTLPNDIGADFVNNIGMKYLRITSSDGATVAMTGGHDDKDNAGYSWAEGSVMCNMSLNSAAEFVVTAENGSQKTYYITIAYTVPDAPTVSDGTAERTSDSAATVKFTSSEAGKYYYAVVNSGAAAPTINTSGAGTSAVAGENTISISNLTAGARDIYIVVKGVSGVESVAYKVAIPAFSSDEGQFSITVTAPQGGTITPSKTKANAGDVITIAVTPNAGYQMVPGSLSYTIAVAGGATNAVENFTFEMPNADVTITCQWETAKEVTDGITGFSIDGVVGVVNNNTNKITITMPYGTDVTKLVPIFTTNNVASISPSPDEAIDFSEPVTFTVTLSNGSVKTYVVNVYVMAGSPAQEMWDKLADIYEKSPWWEYADHQISHAKYPKYW